MNLFRLLTFGEYTEKFINRVFVVVFVLESRGLNSAWVIKFG